MAKKIQHVVPGEVVRATLADRGVNSVNLATQWAATHGITPSRIVAIVRGKRERVPFAQADEIATALGMPELWRMDWAQWAAPPIPEGAEVRIVRIAKFIGLAGDGGAIVEMGGREVVVPLRTVEARACAGKIDA